MRALRVVGVTGDGSVVLEDPGRRERYTVPADEQLRAAARGDVTRLGQIAIELESQLRPREIQARIRGGASVDEVAAAAGVPTQKIERFAYPVLLERSRTAELAQGAHPQRADGPDSRTLGETVAHTFGLRGQDYGGAGWDSWKGEDGKWVVVLTWQTGRSDNAAHWAFQPGAHGGTVVALDEHASDLVEGLPARPLRPLGAVVDMARDEDHTPQAPTTAAPARAVAAAGGHQPEAWAGRGIAPEQRRASPRRPGPASRRPVAPWAPARTTPGPRPTRRPWFPSAPSRSRTPGPPLRPTPRRPTPRPPTARSPRPRTLPAPTRPRRPARTRARPARPRAARPRPAPRRTASPRTARPRPPRHRSARARPAGSGRPRTPPTRTRAPRCRQEPAPPPPTGPARTRPTRTQGARPSRPRPPRPQASPPRPVRRRPPRTPCPRATRRAPPRRRRRPRRKRPRPPPRRTPPHRPRRTRRPRARPRRPRRRTVGPPRRPP
nr:septation protein SepH [Pseudonocardia sp. AL041005-10]